MSLFSDLYKRRQKENKHDSENFLTELFAFVLQNDKEFQLAFFKNFLQEKKGFCKELKFENYTIKISTQKKYKIPKQDNKDDRYAQPDIEIEFFEEGLHKALFFIENKIESSLGNRETNENDENVNQLLNYEKVLLEKREKKSKNIFLIYLTKYYEDISAKFDTSKDYFKQITWNEVFQHTLSAQVDNNNKISIISQFKQYLTDLGMNNTNSFNTRDITVFQDFFNSTYMKMCGIIEFVKTQTKLNFEKKVNFIEDGIYSKVKIENSEIYIGFWKGNENEDNANFHFIYEEKNNESKLKKLVKEKSWEYVNGDINKIVKYILLKDLFSKTEDHNVFIAKFCIEAIEELKEENSVTLAE